MLEDAISHSDVCNVSLSAATEGIICCWNRLSTVVFLRVCVYMYMYVCAHVLLMKRETMEELENVSCVLNLTSLF